MCLNGHPIRERSRSAAAQPTGECSACGAQIISTCLGCRDPIPPALTRLPQYCTSCGRPFPWTERAMSHVRTVIREVATLDQYERDQFRRSLDHIVRETPRTGAAVRRINQMLSRIGGDAAQSLRALVISIAADEVKRQFLPENSPPV